MRVHAVAVLESSADAMQVLINSVAMLTCYPQLLPTLRTPLDVGMLGGLVGMPDSFRLACKM